ncbi:MAG: hypothetical protein U0235_20720 [Polyangiaceae bacterium]
MKDRKRWLGFAVLGILVACGSSPESDSPATGDDARGGAGTPGGGSAGAPASVSATAGFALTDVAYVAATQGPRLLVAGRAAAHDDVFVRVEFLDATLAPKAVDDGAGGSLSAIDLHAIADGAGAFFVENQSSPGFEHDVAAVKLSLRDAQDKPAPGDPRVVSFAQPAIRELGAACDSRGFDACAKDALCAPRANGYTCALESDVRRDACATAPALDPAIGKNVTDGEVSAPTLWDAPLGCVQAGALGAPYPEAYVRLHLDAPEAALTLTTNDPATDLDTVLFVVPSCQGRSATPVACNDDDLGTTNSRLVLENLAAGDYIVVVQSASSARGHFRLSARRP